jgi:hypothetical protein
MLHRHITFFINPFSLLKFSRFNVLLDDQCCFSLYLLLLFVLFCTSLESKNSLNATSLMTDVAEYSSFSCVVLMLLLCLCRQLFAEALQLQITLVKFLQRHRSVIIFPSMFFFL